MKNHKVKIKHLSFSLIPFLFLITLTAPFLCRYNKTINSSENLENRKLAEEPELDINHLDPYPKNYENYYNDHFGLRNTYLEFNNYLEYKFYNKIANTKKVHQGKDGWLFYNGSYLPNFWAEDSIEQYQLKKYTKEINKKQAYLKKRNCSFYIAVIPSKPSVYPENTNLYPEHNTLLCPQKTEQIIKHIQTHTTVPIIDLRKTLVNKKETGRVFQKYDHHWNNLGGFFASQEILNVIKKHNPRVRNPLNLNDFTIEWRNEKGGDLAKMAGIQNFVDEKRPKIEPKENTGFSKAIQGKKRNYPMPKDFAYKWGYEIARTTNNDSLPNAMIIRDSYGSYIKNFLSYGFNKTLLIWDKWNYKLNKDILKKEKPEIFIIMIPEKNLHKLID